jgi:hypothetical protein
MASGINSTFRQIGLATSIAALGSIFSTTLGSKLANALAATPLAGRTDQIVNAVRQGQPPPGGAALPPAQSAELQSAIRSSFTSSLDILLVVTAVLALVGGVASTLLIREKDFVYRQSPRPAGTERPPADGTQG